MSNFNQPNYQDKETQKNRVRYLRVNENWAPQQVKPRARETAGIDMFQQKHGEKK